MINKDRPYHVIEQNILGDHVTIKTFSTKEEAELFCIVMRAWSEDGEVYYIEDIREQYDC